MYISFLFIAQEHYLSKMYVCIHICKINLCSIYIYYINITYIFYYICVYFTIYVLLYMCIYYKYTIYVYFTIYVYIYASYR